jgi:hypothetical protein
MKAIELKSGLWLIGESERLAVGRDRYGLDTIGYVVQGDDALWRIDGRNDEFDSATSAANELVKSVTGRPI